MPAPTVFAENRQFVGIAKEATPFTPVAMSATIPVASFDAVDKPLFLPDDNLRGSFVDEYDVLQGPLYAEITFGGNCYVDTIVHLLRNILGDYAGTGANPYTHALAVLNSGTGQPLTHTITDFDGIASTGLSRWYAGVALTELTFTWNAETALLTYTAKGLSAPSAIPGAAPSPAPSAVRAQPSWQMLVGVGGPASGGTQIKTAVDGTFSIKRTASVRWSAQNSQQPYIISRGKCGVDGSIRMIAADESPLAALLGNTIQQVQWLISGGAAQALQFDMANFSYRDAPRDHSKELIEWNTTFKAEGNTTNAGASGGYSPAKVTVTNAVLPATY